MEQAIFPSGAKDANQENDVKIVCEAIRYESILITDDGESNKQPGGILGNRHKIKNRVKIFSSIEAVEYICRKIQERDDITYKLYECGKIATLPSWFEQDDLVEDMKIFADPWLKKLKNRIDRVKLLFEKGYILDDSHWKDEEFILCIVCLDNLSNLIKSSEKNEETASATSVASYQVS